MSAFRSLFWLLFGSAGLATLAVLLALASDSPNQAHPGLMLAWLVMAATVLSASLWLWRCGRPGLGCCLLLLGTPSAFIGFVFLVFAVNPIAHH